MREKIAERFPDHGIFGEEEGMKQPKDTEAQYLWVLDPIDGTKSFITGQYVYLYLPPWYLQATVIAWSALCIDVIAPQVSPSLAP